MEDDFSDDEHKWLNDGKLDLQALSNRSPFLKIGLFFIVTALTFSAAWVFFLSASLSELEHTQLEEIKLKDGLAFKLSKAHKFVSIKQQQRQVLHDVELLETALSRKGEMAGLLKDINRAGLSRGLQFELFRPEKEVITAHYAELPVSLRVTGRYHPLGLFAADIASLPRLVVLDHLSMTPLKDGHLLLEASLHAYRHLEAEERPVPQNSSPDQGRKP